MRSIQDDTHLLLSEAQSPKRDGLRRFFEILGTVAGLVGLGLAVVGIYQSSEALRQNSEEVAGLKNSLQREQVDSGISSQEGWCGQPSPVNKVTSLLMTVYITNVGRLPVTVLRAGEVAKDTDFAWVRLDDPSATAHRGPFLLDVGQAVAVEYASPSPTPPTKVQLLLSDGKLVTAKTVDVDNDWLNYTNVGENLENAKVECAGGERMSLTMQQFENGFPTNPVFSPGT